MIIFFYYAMVAAALACRICPPCPLGYGLDRSSGCCEPCTRKQGQSCSLFQCCIAGQTCGDDLTCQPAPEGKCAKGKKMSNLSFCGTDSLDSCESACCELDRTLCSGVKASCGPDEVQVFSSEIPSAPPFGDNEHYCCVHAPPCTGYQHCPAGKRVAKGNFCTGAMVCRNNSADRQACCEADPTTCGGQTIECAAGYLQDPEKAMWPNGDTENEKKARCCKKKSNCAESFRDSDCASDEFLDKDFPRTTLVDCCKKRGKCSADYKCPEGFKVKATPESLFCAQATCTESDSAQCCEADETKCAGVFVNCSHGTFQDPDKNGNDAGTAGEDRASNCCSEQATCAGWHAEVEIPDKGPGGVNTSAANGLSLASSWLVFFALLAN